MNKLINSFTKACQPAQAYAVLAILSLLPLLFVDIDTVKNEICVGNTKCIIKNEHMTLPRLMFMKVLMGVIHFFILNMICNKVSKTFAWILVFFPFILIVVGFVLAFLGNLVYIIQK